MNIQKEIAKRIKIARKKSGLKSYKMALILNAHPGQVSRWESETGRFSPQVSTIRNIARLTNVSVDWLLCMDIDQDSY